MPREGACEEFSLRRLVGWVKAAGAGHFLHNADPPQPTMGANSGLRRIIRAIRLKRPGRLNPPYVSGLVLMGFRSRLEPIY
jgi:hypothetical protein